MKHSSQIKFYEDYLQDMVDINSVLLTKLFHRCHSRPEEILNPFILQIQLMAILSEKTQKADVRNLIKTAEMFHEKIPERDKKAIKEVASVLDDTADFLQKAAARIQRIGIAHLN